MILGLTKDRTVFGKSLRQGASALVKDGRLIAALAEERATREKQAGGYAASIGRVLEAGRASLDHVDVIAVSTCCEPKDEALRGHPLEGDSRLIAVSHHLSHATLAFYGSGFDRALVVVADGGGNVLDGTATRMWWQQPREQMSYYLGTRSGGLELVDRDFDRPCEVGLGELYRAFTYFLGWQSSRFASRVMALSAYGRRTYYTDDVYELIDGRLQSPLRNDPADPIHMVRELA